MADPFDAFFSADLSANPGIPGVNPLPAPSVKNMMAPKLPTQAPSMASKDNIVNALDYMRTNHQGAVINPMSVGKEYMFGAQRENHNFERYYNKSNFKQLGFRAARDNEALYNENSSWADDMASAAGQWGTLFSLGMRDAFGFGDLTDQANAFDFEKAMNIGSSSKGGLSGFTTNLFLNSGYSVGILAEVALEEVAIAAGSLLAGIPSGGTSLVAGGALMAARGARAGNKLYRGWQVGKNLLKTLDSMKDINKARAYFQSAAVNAGKFINPLENTTDFFKGINKIDDFQNLNGMAKTAMGFGAFYRDVRNVRLAWSESGLEGGMVRNEMEEKLYDEFVQKNGRTPNMQEVEALRDTAAKAGYTTAWLNLPTIYFSNKIVFDNMFKSFNPMRRITQDVVEKTAAGQIVFNKKMLEKPFEVVESGWKGFLKTAKNPRSYANVGANYFKANLAEGLQESAQEIISGASKDYYTELYKGTPLKGGYWASVGENIQKQFSGTGFETFMSGFLMGGLIQPVTKAPSYLKSTYSKFKDPTAYQAQKAKGVEQLNEMVNNLNDMYADPLKYFNQDLANLESQSRYDEAAQEASEQGDSKAYHDIKDASFYDHVYTALRANRMDTFIERMEDMKNLSPEEVEQTYKMDHASFVSKIDKSVERAKNIQQRFEVAENRFNNPFNPRAHEFGSPDYIASTINYLGWQAAQKEFVFNAHSFDRTLERMTNIMGEAKNDAKLSKMAMSDFNALFSFDSAQQEIDMLQKELKSYSAETATPDQKKDIRYKEKKKEYLENFLSAMQDVMTEPIETDDQGSVVQRSGKSIDLDGGSQSASVKKAYKAYEKYLKHVAKTSKDYVFDDNIQTAFAKIMDYYQLNEESQRLMDSVNMLLNPRAFAARAQRLAEIKEKLYNEREQEIRNGMESYMEKVELNRLLQLLADIGVYLDSQDIEPLLEKGILPKKFYRIENREGNVGLEREVPKGDPLYYEAVELLKNYMTDILEKPVVEDIPQSSQGSDNLIQFDQTGDVIPKKYTLNRANTELEQAPKITFDSVNMQESGIDLTLDEIKQIKLIEIRGKNNDGVVVGTIWLQRTDRTSDVFEVKFNDIITKQEEITEEAPVEQPTLVKLMPTTPIAELKQHPELMRQLLQAYKEFNASQEERGLDPYDENWSLKSDQELMDSLPFRNAFVKMNSRSRSIINAYNQRTGRTQEAAPQQAPAQGMRVATDINPQMRERLNALGYSNTQIDNLSRTDRIKIVTEGIPVEDWTITQPAPAAAPPAQEVPTQWNRTLKQQVLDLGYSEEERRAMTPAEAFALVQSGVTKQQRDEEAALATRAEEQELAERRAEALEEVDNLVNNSKNIEELGIAEQTIFEIFMDPDLRRLTGLTADIIQSKIDAKKQELAFSFTFEDLVVGEVVIMNNPQQSKAIVVNKTNDTVFLEAFDNRSIRYRVKQNKVQERIKYKYSPLMQEIELTPETEMTPEEQQLSNQSQQNAQEVVVDRDAVQRMINTAREGGETGWLDNINECE